MRKSISFLLVFSVLLFVFFLTMIFQSNAKGDTGYVGAKKCSMCHEQIYSNYIKSIHNKKAIPDSPANQEGCEACHGPGAEHVETGGRNVAIFAFTGKIDAKDKSAKCLACHEEMKSLAFWNVSRHKSADVSCDNCHSIHTGVGKLLKAEDPHVCFDCHKDIVAKLNKQSHHPVREGRIKCFDCHDPMSTFGPKMVKADSVNDLCYKCHAEKKGPFAWEHPPVAENCLFCHQAHGSNHSYLLDKKVPQLCQSCHNVEGHPSLPYNTQHTFKGNAPFGKNRMFARSCRNCHTNIHGSNHPALGTFFIR